MPNQYLLDPRYAPPQQYIMSKQTPRCGTWGTADPPGVLPSLPGTLPRLPFLPLSVPDCRARLLACRAPPAPVAALLSPVLWQLNAPDRFDMYSVGVVLLQMAFPLLRGDNTLINFNK